MARSKYAGDAGSGEDDVNITPLLDIVFIMLIFFIVTSTFVKEPGVDIERPLAETTRDRKLASILVGITSDNKIFINKEEISLGEVRVAVEALKRENPKGTAVIQADAGSESQYLIEVVNQMKDAGVEDIAVSTDPR